MALISNPIDEVTGPLERVEASLTQLCRDLGSLDVLPDMNEGVLRTNERLERIEEQVTLARLASEQTVTVLDSIRSELGEAVRMLALTLGTEGPVPAAPLEEVPPATAG